MSKSRSVLTRGTQNLGLKHQGNLQKSDSSAVQLLVEKYGHARDLKGMPEYMEKLCCTHHVVEKMWSKALSLAGRQEDTQMAKEVLRMMKIREVPLDAYSYSCLLAVYKRNWRAINNILYQMKVSGLELDIGNRCQVIGAIRFRSDLSLQEIQTEANIHYEKALAAHPGENLERVHLVMMTACSNYSEAVKYRGVLRSPDTQHVYNALLSVCKRSEDPESALFLISKEMVRKGFTVDSDHWAMVFACYCRDMKGLHEAWKNMRRKIPLREVDLGAYTAFIRSCTVDALESAELRFAEALNRGFATESSLWHTMLKLYMAHGEDVKFYALFSRMLLFKITPRSDVHRYYSQLRLTEPKQAAPDFLTTRFVANLQNEEFEDSYWKHGRGHRASYPVIEVLVLRWPIETAALDRLLSNNVPIRGGVLKKLLQHDADGVKYLKARFQMGKRDMPGVGYKEYAGLRRGLEDVMGGLRRGGVAGERTYITMLTLCNKLNFRSKTATALVQHAQADGVRLSAEAFVEVLRSATGKEGSLNTITQTLRLMAAQNEPINPNVTYSILRALGSWGSNELVFKVATTLTVGHMAAAVPYSILLGACSTPYQALVIARDMQARNLRLDTACYIAMFGCCVRAANVDVAEKMFECIPEAQGKAEYWERLGAVYHAAGDVVGVENVVLRSLECGMAVSERLFVLLISSYARCGDMRNLRDAFVSFPEFQDLWSVQVELMTCCAVLGDTATADAVWDARPQSSAHSQKVSLTQLYRYREAYLVAKLSQTRGAWSVMATLMAHHSVGHASYCLLYAGARRVRENSKFGLKALVALTQRLRTALPPTKAILPVHGNLKSPEIDRVTYAMSLEDDPPRCLHVSSRHSPSFAEGAAPEFTSVSPPIGEPTTLAAVLDAMLKGVRTEGFEHEDEEKYDDDDDAYDDDDDYNDGYSTLEKEVSELLAGLMPAV